MNSYNKLLLTRKKLYDEIWELSAAGVAKKYNLHYTKLIKSLKENNIPYPPCGYWTKLACGKDVSGAVIPLPDADIEDVYLYLADYSTIKKNRTVEKQEILEQKGNPQKTKIEESNNTIDTSKEQKKIDSYLLSYLPGEERDQVIQALANIEVKTNAKLHPVLVAYKKSIQEWRQKESQYNIRRAYYDRGTRIEQPALLSEVSEIGINRAISILDAIYKTVEKLGGLVMSNFSLKIRADVVKISFVEAQDKREHELTKKEAKELLDYKEKHRFDAYASKPQIRKYDYYYNGKLRIKFDNGKYIKDNEQQKLEDQLDNILIQLYEISERHRIDREKRELEHQRYQEEQRRKEEEADRILEENKKTQALVNEAKDYQIASDIRAYIQAIMSKGELTEEKQDWIKWAEQKADWYDPTIAIQDKYLGGRKHAASEEDKQLKSEIRRSGLRW